MPTRLVALSQAGVYLVTGAWPLVSMRSFERVTGPKHDDWLVRTVGGLAIAFGAGLAARAGDARAARPFGVAAALAFLSADLVGVASGRLRRVYLLDAVAEATWLVGWGVTAVRPRRARPRPVSEPPSGPGSPAHLRADASGRPSAVAIRQELEERIAEAVRAAQLAWSDGRAPDAVTSALHRLLEIREELAFIDDEADLPRARELAISVMEDAHVVHEATDLISS
jgi:hypothetical protein